MGSPIAITGCKFVQRLSIAAIVSTLALAANARGSYLSTTSSLDGATGRLETCVAIHDSSGQLQTTENGDPEYYQASFTLMPDGSEDEYLFQLASAAHITTDSCSGKYQEGVFTDTVLLENIGEPFNGKLYHLRMTLAPEQSSVLKVDTAPNALYEVRDLARNTSSIGSVLGSFQASETIPFNTVNVPHTYTLVAPQCVDSEGDTSVAVIESNGALIDEVTPGTAFSLDTRDFTSGSYQLKAYCSDSRQDESSLSAAYGARSAYASGTLTFAVAAEEGCTIPVSYYMQNMDENYPENVPSWDELACFTSSLTRKPAPGYFIQAADEPSSTDGDGEERGTFFEFASRSIDYFTDWPQSNANFVNLQEAPPYLMNGEYQFTDEQWDLKLRGMAAYGIYLKYLGERISWTYYYPPHLSEPGAGLLPIMNNVDELLQWWEEVYIPERVQLAEVAELVQAEYYQPWDVEPGQQLRAAGDLFLDELSEEEQVAVTQQMIDTLYAAIRPIFSGKLIVITYDRWEFYGHMKALDFSEWDQVHFVLFTEGDAEGTEIYLQSQLAGIIEIVQRDGLENWVLQEVTVNGETHQRLLDQYPPYYQFQDIEADIYRVLFDAIDAMSIQPKGIGITTGHIETQEAWNLVQDKLTELAR